MISYSGLWVSAGLWEYVCVCVHVMFDTETTSVCLVWDDAHEL